MMKQARLGAVIWGATSGLAWGGEGVCQPGDHGGGSPPGAAESGEVVIREETLRQLNRDILGEAVALPPGMSRSRNSRNEDIVYLRGFAVRQVQLFIDGIPAYVSCDGYVDFGRFTTFDLAGIRVAKRATSGPVSGAVACRSRLPA